MLPEMIRVAKACEAPRRSVVEMPVSLTVDVPAVKTEAAPDVSQEPDAEMDPLVRERMFAERSFIVNPATEMEAVVTIRAPPPEIARLAPPVISFPDVVSVPVIERLPLTSMAPLCVTVPEMTKV
jgi:hypothetical protein